MATDFLFLICIMCVYERGREGEIYGFFLCKSAFIQLFKLNWLSLSLGFFGWHGMDPTQSKTKREAFNQDP